MDARPLIHEAPHYLIVEDDPASLEVIAECASWEQALRLVRLLYDAPTNVYHYQIVKRRTEDILYSTRTKEID